MEQKPIGRVCREVYEQKRSKRKNNSKRDTKSIDKVEEAREESGNKLEKEPYRMREDL